MECNFSVDIFKTPHENLHMKEVGLQGRRKEGVRVANNENRFCQICEGPWQLLEKGGSTNAI